MTRILEVPQKGARGYIVASRNRFGRFHRERVSPDQPGTPAQRLAWDNHIQLERSRIFIRAWQQINGRVNEVGMFQTSTLVPPNWRRLRISPLRGTKKAPRQ
jgi:hypothetical protein